MSTLNGKLGRLLQWVRTSWLPSRLERSFPEFPEEVRRPAIFSLWFWSALAASYLIWEAYPFDVGWGFDLVLATLAAGVLATVWLVLPWDPRASRRRKLAAPAFLASVFAMNQLFGGVDWSLAFYPLAFANGVFLFGFRRGIVYAAATLIVIFTDTLLTIRLAYPEYAAGSAGWSVGNALGLAAFFVPVAAFFIGVCIPIVEANRRREETESLLGELEAAHAELGSAYAELKNYAKRARELTLSEERARMAREMHDSVGHYLTVVNVQLEAATKFMDKDPEKASEEVAKAKTLASEALSEVRRSVRALKPLAVERRSVVALSTLARDFERAGPTVSFKVGGEERSLPTEPELVLYRALQESLTNALKHSKARRISVSLTFGEDSVRLKVNDDGLGAPEDAYERGFGLPALRERAEALGGTLKAGNASEGGFALEVELPMGPSARPS